MAAPLRPTAEEIGIAVALAGPALTEAGPGCMLLVLGGTPELTTAAWPGEPRVVAVDLSADVAASVWAPNTVLASSIVLGRWQALPLGAQSAAAAVGDGALNVLPHPNAYGDVLKDLARVLTPAAPLVLRCFLKPEDDTEPEDIAQDALAGRLSGFHALKWRLAAALAGRHDPSVGVAEIHHCFERLFPDRDALAEAAGWPRAAIDTIDVYAGQTARYSFPTLGRLEQAAAPYFGIEKMRCGAGPFGKHGPTVLFRQARPADPQ